MRDISTLIINFNHSAERHKLVFEVPCTKKVIAILKCLLKVGYISGYSVVLNKVCVVLKYTEGTPLIKCVKQISKPSNRVYIKGKDLRNLNKVGCYYLYSTTQGIFISNFKQNLNNKNCIGGELLMKIT